MLDNLCEQAVRGRKGTDSNICGSLLALWNSIKELPEILQSGSLQNLIKWAGGNMKHWYTNNPADDLWINLRHMPLYNRLKENATVLILHNLQMRIELSDQPGEHNTSTIVEVASVICLNDVIDNIKGCYHNTSPNNIHFWNNWLVRYSGSRSSNAFLCPLANSAL
jgi:hypothetical protein